MIGKKTPGIRYYEAALRGKKQLMWNLPRPKRLNVVCYKVHNMEGHSCELEVKIVVCLGIFHGNIDRDARDLLYFIHKNRVELKIICHPQSDGDEFSLIIWVNY